MNKNPEKIQTDIRDAFVCSQMQQTKRNKTKYSQNINTARTNNLSFEDKRQFILPYYP